MGLKLKDAALALGLFAATPALGVVPGGEEVTDEQDVYEAMIYDVLYEGDFSVKVKGYRHTETVKTPFYPETAAEQPAEPDVRIYFVITEYDSPDFEKILREYIASGNGVNRLENGQIWFALGCTGPVNALLSEDAKTRISSSKKDKPVSVTLGFSSELSLAPDGDCISLADSVR